MLWLVISYNYEDNESQQLVWLLANSGNGFENEGALKVKIKTKLMREISDFANVFIATRFVGTNEHEMFEMVREKTTNVLRPVKMIKLKNGKIIEIEKIEGSAYVFIIQTTTKITQ